MSTLTPTVRSVLATLNRKRWDELARAFSVIMPTGSTPQEAPLLETLALTHGALQAAIALAHIG